MWCQIGFKLQVTYASIIGCKCNISLLSLACLTFVFFWLLLVRHFYMLVRLFSLQFFILPFLSIQMTMSFRCLRLRLPNLMNLIWSNVIPYGWFRSFKICKCFQHWLQKVTSWPKGRLLLVSSVFSILNIFSFLLMHFCMLAGSFLSLCHPFFSSPSEWRCSLKVWGWGMCFLPLNFWVWTGFVQWDAWLVASRL